MLYRYSPANVNPFDYAVRMGSERLSANGLASWFNVTAATVHPSYDPKYFSNDIAVLHLSAYASLSTATSWSACVPPSWPLPLGPPYTGLCQAVGWTTSTMDLQVANVTLLPQQLCSTTDNTALCAGHVSAAGTSSNVSGAIGNLMGSAAHPCLVLTHPIVCYVNSLHSFAFLAERNSWCRVLRCGRLMVLRGLVPR